MFTGGKLFDYLFIFDVWVPPVYLAIYFPTIYLVLIFFSFFGGGGRMGYVEKRLLWGEGLVCGSAWHFSSLQAGVLIVDRRNNSCVLGG